MKGIIERTIATAIFFAGALTAMPATAQFPDAHDPPPAGWTGPVFRLSQSYPATLPKLEPASKRRWASFDFRDPVEAPNYLRAVLDYCFEGNIANTFADVGNNPVRKWYHTPWLHSGSGGREFIHGLTRERPSDALELGPQQTSPVDNWAVGFYNDRGAHTIGQVWGNPTEPDPRKSKFPTHTVSCKLLFTRATVAQVPFLEGSLEWEGDVNRAAGTAPRPKLRLLQIDVAVKDPRASSTTGWVFGTFQYEKGASTSSNWFDHMVPVGLMWGNDVVKVLANQPPRQQWINTARGQQLHLGFRGLLNGPIDNPKASCSACHGLAQVKRINAAQPSIPQKPGEDTVSDDVIKRYFKNMKANTALSSDYVSTDYSLQLQFGISRALTSGEAHLPANMARRLFSRRAVATETPIVGRDGTSPDTQ